MVKQQKTGLEELISSLLKIKAEITAEIHAKSIESFDKFDKDVAIKIVEENDDLINKIQRYFPKIS